MNVAATCSSFEFIKFSSDSSTDDTWRNNHIWVYIYLLKYDNWDLNFTVTSNTVELSYNNIGTCDTSSIASDILCPKLIPLLTITLFSLVITTLIHNDIK